MPADLPLRCSCGTVRGVARGVSAARGNRVACYCDDCQSFAWFLGRADEILDAHGGTDIFQMSPARLELGCGREQLACLRLTPGGLLRWYADCCKTPIGNTMAARQVPFVGLVHSFCDHAAHGPSRDETLGPVRGRVNGRFAAGDRSTLDAHDRAPFSMLPRLAWMIGLARLRGEHARSVFFDAETGELSVDPRVLTPEELQAVEQTRDSG